MIGCLYGFGWPNIPWMIQNWLDLMQSYALIGSITLFGATRAVVFASKGFRYRPVHHDLIAAENAVRLDPQDADAWFDLGDARAALKDYFGAREAFAQATVLNPVDGEALYYRARSCAAIGENGEASDLVAKAIALKPELLHLAASDPALYAVRNHSPFRELLR